MEYRPLGMGVIAGGMGGPFRAPRRCEPFTPSSTPTAFPSGERERLREEGLLRACGVSTDSALRRFNAEGKCAACQRTHSVLNRSRREGTVGLLSSERRGHPQAAGPGHPDGEVHRGEPF